MYWKIIAFTYEGTLMTHDYDSEDHARTDFNVRIQHFNDRFTVLLQVRSNSVKAKILETYPSR